MWLLRTRDLNMDRRLIFLCATLQFYPLDLVRYHPDRLHRLRAQPHIQGNAVQQAPGGTLEKSRKQQWRRTTLD